MGGLRSFFTACSQASKAAVITIRQIVEGGDKD
jgi:hypothetical protein